MADNRSVHTDALQTLGNIIGPYEKRDAIHLAVEPAIAAETLRPGQDVGFVSNGVGVCDKPLGIVDPFLKGSVAKGDRFWLIVYPRQITSLRHVWAHPEFPESVELGMVSDWDAIHRAAHAIGVSTSSLMYSLEYYVKNCSSGNKDRIVCFGEEIEARELPEGFWPHYETVTGVPVPEEFRNVYFRCSC